MGFPATASFVITVCRLAEARRRKRTQVISTKITVERGAVGTLCGVACPVHGDLESPAIKAESV